MEGMIEPKLVCPTCGRKIDKEAEECPFCHFSTRLYPDTDARGRKGRWEQDLQHCTHCGKEYKDEDDNYCRYCGTKRDWTPGRYFVVSPEYLECVYGPMPVTLYYHCRKCGNQWTCSNWDDQYYCPKCGDKVSGEEREETAGAKKKASLFRKFFD